MPDETVNEQLAASFSKVLNRNGYGFQYAVLEKARELAQSGKSHFRFSVSEFPVNIQGKDTRIDFILQRFFGHGNDGITIYLVCECKRVNPAYSNWFFLKSPLVARNQVRHDKHFIVETIQHDEEAKYTSETKQPEFIEENYHLGLDVKTDKTGDPKGEMGEAIENACSQVLRGVNGLIQSFIKQPEILGKVSETLFIPVIFTTAELFVTDADIAKADLLTGELNLTVDDIKQIDWLYYQYPMSIGLKHSLDSGLEIRDLTSLLYKDHIRTIPIVSANGIESFLETMSHHFVAY